MSACLFRGGLLQTCFCLLTPSECRAQHSKVTDNVYSCCCCCGCSKGERKPAAIRPSIMQRRFLQKPAQNLPPAVRMVDRDIWRVNDGDKFKLPGQKARPLRPHFQDNSSGGRKPDYMLKMSARGALVGSHFALIFQRKSAGVATRKKKPRPAAARGAGVAGSG